MRFAGWCFGGGLLSAFGPLPLLLILCRLIWRGLRGGVVGALKKGGLHCFRTAVVAHPAGVLVVAIFLEGVDASR